MEDLTFTLAHCRMHSTTLRTCILIDLAGGGTKEGRKNMVSVSAEYTSQCPLRTVPRIPQLFYIFDCILAFIKYLGDFSNDLDE